MNGEAKNMIRTALSTFGLAVALLAFGLPLFISDVAVAQDESALAQQKAEWQDRYRTLLRNQALLRSNIEISHENYARAQRRNYPRGGARQQFIIDAENAEKELVVVKEEIVQIAEDARHAGIPPKWLYEVDDEPLTAAPPASASDEKNDEEDRAGRNPLYFEDK